jgi:hypothetical protein
MTIKHRLSLAGIILFLGNIASAHAQEASAPRAPTRVPVTLVLVETPLPGNERWVISRRPDVSPHDVILLQANADADQLSDAVRALITVRQVNGDTASRGATMRMRPQQLNGNPRRQFPWIPRVLADLRHARPQPIAGVVGSVRAVQIWLPPQYRRPAKQ